MFAFNSILYYNYEDSNCIALLAIGLRSFGNEEFLSVLSLSVVEVANLLLFITPLNGHKSN